MMIFWVLFACASELRYITDLDSDGYTISDGDCDDSRSSVNPNQPEACFDGVDNNCDGLVDEGEAEGSQAYYLDEDGDGFGDADDFIIACEPPSSSHVFTGDDCDDTNSDVNPDQSEICNGIDDNCDEKIDDEDLNDIEYTEQDALYLDDDGDGYGVSGADPLYACEDRERYARNDGDCNDDDETINPGVPELCATVGIDDNCDGLADNSSAAIDLLTWYFDSDSDGYGAGDPLESCTAMVGYSAVGQDCDDNDDLVFPNSHSTELLAYGDVDCDGDAACKDLYCDSRIDLFLPTYPELGQPPVESTHIYSVSDNDSLEISSSPINPMGYSINATYSFGVASPVDSNTGFRKLALAQRSGDCSGKAILTNINDHGISNSTTVIWNPVTSMQFLNLYDLGEPYIVAAVGTHPLYGILDICPGSDGGPELLMNGHNNTFYSDMLNYGGHKVIVEDLDDDGYIDMVFCRGLEADGIGVYSSSEIAWGTAEPSTNWVFSKSLSVPNCGDLISADINNDGHLDLVLATASDSNSVNSMIYFGPDFMQVTPLDARASAKVIADDFDNDGYMDLVFGQNPIDDNWNRDLPIFWGDSSYNYQTITSVEAMGCIYPLVVEAGNGDGLDLICPNLRGRIDPSTYEYDPNGELTSAPPSYIYWGGAGNRYNELSRKSLQPGGALHALSGDFNENGQPDLLFTPWFGTEARLYWDEPNDAQSDYVDNEAIRQLGPPLAIGSGD